MLFRGRKPEVTVWKRFRSGQDGFTFTRIGDHYEAKVSANSERIVDLFYTLSEVLPPAIDVFIEDLRTQQSWQGESIALPDVRDVVARLKVLLSSFGGIEMTFYTAEDQVTLSPQLELVIYSRSDRWLYLLQSKNLEERAALADRAWGGSSWDRSRAPALSDALASAAARLSLRSA
jgi:hypothetical protein